MDKMDKIFELIKRFIYTIFLKKEFGTSYNELPDIQLEKGTNDKDRVYNFFVDVKPKLGQLAGIPNKKEKNGARFVGTVVAENKNTYTLEMKHLQKRTSVSKNKCKRYMKLTNSQLMRMAMKDKLKI